MKIDKKIIKYLLVGISSTLIDVGSLYVFVDIFGWDLYLSIFISFILSVINGYILNKIYTFNNRDNRYKKQFLKFLTVSLGGLVLTYCFMYIFTNLIGIWYVFSKIITSVFVVIWNFTLNKRWTFKEKQIEEIIKNSNFEFKFSIVIPAYNEQNRILDTIKKIDNYLKNRGDKYEIIVVDDGSRDKTIEVVENLDLNIKVLKNIKNRGKGFSIKKGIMEALGEYILFTDADNSTPIEEIEKLYSFMDEYDIAIGSRYLSESNIVVKQGKIRTFISRGGNFLISYFLLDGFKDTQCGFKMFKNNVAKRIFKMQKTSGFGFDMEILLAGKTLGYKIKEVPVFWFDSALESKVNPIRDLFKTFIELLVIKINHLFDGYK